MTEYQPIFIGVEVLQKDISRAIAQDEKHCGNCPIALALERATKMKWKVSPGGAYTQKYGRVDLPFEARKFIQKYDNNELVSATSFEVTVTPQ